MSTETIRVRRSPWLTVGAVVAVAVAGYYASQLFRSAPSVTTETRAEGLTVAEGEAGKVGDLQVTEEALQLAEITVSLAEAKLVSEKLAVSGNVQAGGDQLVKITPPVAGKVVKLLVGVGEDVRPGQTLALLESKELAEAQSAYRQAQSRHSAAKGNLDRQRRLAGLGQFGGPSVEEARTKLSEAEQAQHETERDLAEETTALAEAESELQSLRSRVNQAKTELEVAKARLDRAESLYKEGLISKQDLERIQADHKKAIADVEVAQSDVSQGESRIKGGKTRVAAIEGALDQSKRRTEIARKALEREEKVFEGGFLTSKEVVEAESSLRQAEVELGGAADAVHLLGGSPGSGNRVALTSPISGKVQDRSATLGETIDPEHAAFTVVNLDRVWAQLAVAPGDLGSVRIGDSVELTSESTPDKVFRGTVLSVGSSADETTRAVYVRTTLENPGDLLKPGSFVSGFVVTDVRKERVVVPIGALQEHTGRPTVYVSIGDKPGAFEVRHVVLGVEGDGWREISDGLKPGERIAVSGTFFLKSEALKSSLSDGCCAPAGG